MREKSSPDLELRIKGNQVNEKNRDEVVVLSVSDQHW